MKKTIFVLLALLTFIFMSCDTEPYIVGQVKNEKEFIKALNDPRQDEIMIKAGNYSFNESLDIDRDLKLYVENGTATINFKDKQDGIILTENSLTLSNLNVDGTLSIEDKEDTAPLAETTEVKIPRLVLEGNTTIETLDIKKDVAIEITKVTTEAPIKEVIVSDTVQEITLVGDIEEIPALEEATQNSGILQIGIARIGDEYFESLESALKDSIDGDIVVLLDDIHNADYDNAKSFSINKNITLDGNNHIISGNCAIHINSITGAVLQNIYFKNIHNNNPQSDDGRYGFENKIGNLTAVYASGFSGDMTIQNCTFDTCDWDSIQVTPNAGAKITIENNIFKFNTENDSQVSQPVRYIHVESKLNVDFEAKITNNSMYNCDELKETGLEVYYPTNINKSILNNNYIDNPCGICIIDGKGNMQATIVLPFAPGINGEPPFEPVAYVEKGNIYFYETLEEAKATGGKVVEL